MLARPVDLSQRFTQDDVTVELLTRHLELAKVHHQVLDGTKAILVPGDPGVAIEHQLGRRWLQLVAIYPVPGGTSKATTDGVPSKLLTMNTINYYLPLVRLGHREGPPEAYRFSYSVRLEGGMSGHNLVDTVMVFQELVGEALKFIRKDVGN